MDFKIIKPFDGAYPITQRYGEALSWYIKIAGYPHNGVDWSMPIGTPIKACDNGKIVCADNIPDSNGLGINILHPWGLSQYWHLSSVCAILGAEVTRGMIIGLSGASGWVTGPHLHFGTKELPDTDGVMRGWVDPLLHIENTITTPQPQPIKPQNYMVLPGDSLWKIAQKFYKNGGYWRKIYDANRDKIDNPNVIRAFQVLRIP
jgi:murein DD-endopeptidase MepM/ murein hydrolase activator NlpD